MANKRATEVGPDEDAEDEMNYALNRLASSKANAPKDRSFSTLETAK